MGRDGLRTRLGSRLASFPGSPGTRIVDACTSSISRSGVEEPGNEAKVGVTKILWPRSQTYLISRAGLGTRLTYTLYTGGQVMDAESWGDDVGKSWEVSATRALCRTLLFDSGKAVLFHPEKGNSGDSSPDDGESESCEGKITGDEAKQFYEDVLSMPQQGIKTESIKPTGCRTTQRTHRKKNTVVTDKSKGGGFVSVSQLFRFAQEGDLVSLKPALQSGYEGTYDINIVDNFDWTLLMCAAHAGHMDVVAYLLNEGAGWREFVDRRGNNAADLARKSGHFDIAETIEHFEDHHYHGHHTRNSHKRSRENNGDAGTKSKKQKSFSYYCKTCELNIVESSGYVPSSHDTSTVHQFSCQHHPRVYSYGIPESNRGFQMLVKGGWDPGKGLGSMRQGRQYPVKTILKQDRLGFGLSSKKGGTPRVTHFSAHDENAVRTSRERVRRESSPHKTKRERTRAVERERQWEIRMRRYMNSDS